MMKYGYEHTVPTDNEADAVGGDFTAGDRVVSAPIAVARGLAKLSRGPAHLTLHEKQGLGVLDVPVTTDFSGRTTALVPITLRSWFTVPKAPQVAPRPTPTVTLFYRHQR